MSGRIRHPIRRSSPPRPTSSISASLGSRIVDRHPRATPGGFAPAPTMREPRARRRTWVTRAIGEQRLHGNAQPPVSSPARSRQPTDNAIRGRLVWLEFLFVVYDLLHLAAARKAKAEVFLTLDARNFQALVRPGDPRIESP